MNKSFRVYATNGDEHATVWPIGTGEFFNVHFEEADENWTYSKEQVDNAFEKGYWKMYNEYGPVRDFKFVHNSNEGIVYRAQIFDDNSVLLDWTSNDGTQHSEDDMYHVDEVNDLIARGVWKIVDEGKKVDIGNLKIEIDTSEIRKEFDEIIVGAILAKIKSFTTSFDADVMVVNGAYIVFDNLSETSYKASTEDDLVKIFGAFDVLAEFADA